jgi:hypothetical protein
MINDWWIVPAFFSGLVLGGFIGWEKERIFAFVKKDENLLESRVQSLEEKLTGDIVLEYSAVVGRAKNDIEIVRMDILSEISGLKKEFEKDRENVLAEFEKIKSDTASETQKITAAAKNDFEKFLKVARGDIDSIKSRLGL